MSFIADKGLRSKGKRGLRLSKLALFYQNAAKTGRFLGNLQERTGRYSATSTVAMQAVRVRRKLVQHPRTQIVSSSMPIADPRYSDLPVLEGVNSWAGNPREMRKEDLEFFGLE